MIFKKYEFMYKGKFYYLFFENAGFNNEYMDIWMGDSKDNKEVVVCSTCSTIHPINKVDYTFERKHNHLLPLWLVRLLTKGYHDAFMSLFDDDDILQEKFVKIFEEQTRKRG